MCVRIPLLAALHMKYGMSDPLRSRCPPHEGDTNSSKMSDRILPLVRGLTNILDSGSMKNGQWSVVTGHWQI